LAQELAILERARGALARSDGAQAQRILDAYEQRFARPRLGPEAELLRVEALLALGDEAQARSVAEALLASPAGRAYGRRLRSLLGENADPAGTGAGQ
jgi:hypothetical protein